jgi:ATP-dependent protease ClpP protease subunit
MNPDDAHGAEGNHVDLGKLTNLAEALRERTAPARATQGEGSWFRIHNLGEVTEVYLYDMIGDWGVSAQEFVDQMRTVTGPVDLHINCEGGEVFDGIAIYGAIARHPGPVTAHVDGLAASAASFIVQAASKRVMGKNARMMIHDAHGLAMGNAAVMREMANLLNDLSDNIASIYADRAGGTVADWRARMQAGVDGTWYTAQAAVDVGLADEVTTATQPAPPGRPPVAPTPARVQWDPNAFLATLREVEAPPPVMPAVLPWHQSDDPQS